MSIGYFEALADENFSGSDFSSRLVDCYDFCNLAVQLIENSFIQANQQSRELSFKRFLNFLEALRSRNLDCLSRCVSRMVVRQIIEIVRRDDSGKCLQIATEFAQKFCGFYPAQELRNCNLLSLARGKGKEAVALLCAFGAFQEPNHITVVLFLAELDDWELEEYREYYGLLKQFDSSITKAGLCEWLLDNSTREFENIELQSILCYAVENGQGSLVSKLLNNLKGHGMVDYRLTFSYALLSGQCELVELLVEKQLVDPRKSIYWPRGKYENNIVIDTKDNRDPSKQLPHNITPLAYVGLTGKIDIVRYLLSKGLNPNELGSQDYSPIGLTAYAGHKECLELLLSSKALTMGPCNPYGMTPLHIAVRDLENEDVMNSLLQRGANINAKAEGDITPLMQASISDNLTAVVFLMAKKASSLSTDSEGRNALHLATRPEIMKVLAQESRLLYATDNNGMTALSLTAHCKEAIRILLPRYNQVREADLSEAFWTAICCACPDDAEFLLNSLSKERNYKFLVNSETWDNFVGTAKLGCFYRAPYLKCAPQIKSMIDRYLKGMRHGEGEEWMEEELKRIAQRQSTGNEEEDSTLRDAVDTARKMSRLAVRIQPLFNDNIQEPTQVEERTQARGQSNFYLDFYKTMIVLALIWFYCSPYRLKVSILYIVFTSLGSQYLGDCS